MKTNRIKPTHFIEVYTDDWDILSVYSTRVIPISMLKATLKDTQDIGWRTIAIWKIEKKYPKVPVSSLRFTVYLQLQDDDFEEDVVFSAYDSECEDIRFDYFKYPTEIRNAITDLLNLHRKQLSQELYDQMMEERNNLSYENWED